MNLQLLMTDHCSLCEEALDLLLSMPQLQGLGLQTIDIATDDALLEQYGACIPVLRTEATELRWPFGKEDIRQAIAGA